MTNPKVNYKGNMFLDCDHISEDQYNRFFNKEDITYKMVNLSLKATFGAKDLGLALDYLKAPVRNEIINHIKYGNRYITSNHRLYGDIPPIKNNIVCACEGKNIPYDTLPVYYKIAIADHIINHSEFEGTIS